MVKLIPGPRPMPSFRRMMVFIDGENIVFCYQRLLEKGFSPKDSVKHLRDVYVWEENSIINPGLHDIIRANYYTYASKNRCSFQRNVASQQPPFYHKN